MSVSIDVAWKSLNKHGEELCGDKVEIVKTANSDIVILADGMGSGVKANILSTLTSKILATMVSEGAAIEDCVETIASTLPICRERQVAYATFSVLQIFDNGEMYLAEFDNPNCIFIRNNKLVDYPYTTREIAGKTIREYRCKVEKNDCFILMSDGVIYAGAGEILDLNGWTWDSVAEFAVESTKETLSASRLAAKLSGACNDLYINRPGDDTTVAVARIIDRRIVDLFTGPPEHKEDDERLISDFMAAEGKKIISGGTSANIAARVLGREVITHNDKDANGLPPTAEMKGIDLVTEGVLTLSRAIKILKKFQNDEFDEEFFDELDADNGASKIAKMIIEECTELNMFVGTAMNEAHKDTDLTFDLSMRMNVVEKLKAVCESIGKHVNVKYY